MPHFRKSTTALTIFAACIVLLTVRTHHSQTANAQPSFPAAGNLSQVMRGILFPNANIIFNVQTHDPAEAKPAPKENDNSETFNWISWGSNIYQPWEIVDYAAIALAESAPLMLTP